MAVETLSVEKLQKDAAEAVKYFEAKLAFETGPIGLNMALNNKEPLQIIDLRTPELYAKGHVPGALNILFDDLDKNLSKLKKETTTVVYCYDAVCSLSTKAALHLAQKGYKVKELSGGWQDWVEHDLKVEGKAESSSCSHSSCG